MGESDDEEVDIDQLLASMKQNMQSDEDDIDNQDESDYIDQQTNVSQKEQVECLQSSNDQKSEQKKNQFIIVNEPQVQDNQIDPILNLIESFKKQGCVLNDKEILNYQFNYGLIQENFEQYNKSCQQKLQDIITQQKYVFTNVKAIQSKSTDVLLSVQNKNNQLLKKNLQDYEKTIQTIKEVEINCDKSKFYLLNLIQRMEDMELNLDKQIDKKIKHKQRIESYQQEEKEQVSQEFQEIMQKGLSILKQKKYLQDNQSNDEILQTE